MDECQCSWRLGYVRCTGRYDNISFNMKTTFLVIVFIGKCWDIYSIYWYILCDIGKEEEEEEKAGKFVFAKDQLTKCKQNNGFSF